MYQSTLDLLQAEDLRLEIVRVLEWHAKQRADSFVDLRNLMAMHDEYYPGIYNWFDSKVVQGLINGTRVGYVGYLADMPIAAAVLKIGKKSKICHLSIDTAFQQNNIGSLFFSLMTLEVRRAAKTLHFTLPEHLWEEEKAFFNSYGFETVHRANRQYRLFEEEFWTGASYANVYNSVLPKLAGFSEDLKVGGLSVNTDLLLPVRHRVAIKIFEGVKRYEIRKRFSDKWKGRRATIVSPMPEGQVLGQVTIDNIYRGIPEWIWECFGEYLGISRAEFDSYAGDSGEIVAIHLDEPTAYECPMALEGLRHLTQSRLILPQQYKSLADRKDNWSVAIRLSVLIDGRHRGDIARQKSAVAVDRTSIDQEMESRDNSSKV